MEQNKEIINLIENLKKQKDLLNSEINLGIIDIDGARSELDVITKKEQSLREKMVTVNHVTADGTPRTISFHEATESNPKAFYYTKMADGRKIKATTREGLIEKLFNYYAGGISDLSLKSVFKAALAEKAITENPKQNTLYKNEADFKRFISTELAAKDIRSLTDLELKKYIQEWTKREHPKDKAFLAFKGVLNLAFSYAFSHKIINTNPMDYIVNKPYMKSCDTRKARPEDKILSPEEIEILKAEVRQRMTMKKYGSYYINGYAMLFAIETGVRVGELCAMQWEDIKFDKGIIHIHSQQLNQKVDDKKEYYLVSYTKNEKGESEDGRIFPLTRKLSDLLKEIKCKQEALGIHSNFIFCHEDGEWIKTDAYITFLRRLCQSKSFKVTNNHAFRMSLNSNVFIPSGVSAANRAAMLGHSIETNLRNYSFAQKDYVDDVRELLDSMDVEEPGNPGEPHKIIQFSKKESPENLISQVF